VTVALDCGGRLAGATPGGHCLGRDRTQTKVPSVAALTYGGTRNREPCHVVTDVSSGGRRDRSPQNLQGCLFKLPPNVIKERRPGAWPVGACTGRAASASALIPDTMNTAGRAPTCQPKPADGGRPFASRSPGWVPHPGQKTSSHGVPATSAARMVGDHSMSRPVARRRFPAIDDELCLKARSAVRLQLGGTGFNVEPSCPDAHGASITGPVSEVDPAGRPRLDTAR
jgi:hypothetical protein